MTKRVCTFLLSAALLLSGCQAGQAAPTASGSLSPAQSADISDNQITFTDALGQEFSLERPQRVAAMIGSFADVWCLAGGKDTLVATANDAWTSFDLGLGDEVADLGAVKEPNLELLLSAKPDLILASCNTAANLELKDTFAQAGIPAAYFDIQSFEDYLQMLDICTQLTGCPENYQQYGQEVRQLVDESIARQDGSHPTVLNIRATGSSCKIKGSQDNVLGEMLLDLGCVNVADSDQSMLDNLSLEAIIQADPDYIFAVLQGSDATKAMATLEATLLSNPAWGSLRAVREGHFYTMDHRLYNLKPNALWGESYEKLAEILYPQ